MNTEILTNAGVDYQRGVKRFMGRAYLYEKALSKFPRDGSFARICEAYEARDAEALLASVHEFKGMCGNIALSGLYDTADEMVRMLRSREDAPEKMDAAYQRLTAEYHTICGAIAAAGEAQG